MRNMQNYVQLTGRLLDLPPPRQVSDGSYLLNLRITTGVGFNDQPARGQHVYHLIAWNQLAMEMSDRLKRGSRVIVAGELRNRLLVKNEVQYYRTEILVKEFQVLKEYQKNNPFIHKMLDNEPQ